MPEGQRSPKTKPKLVHVKKGDYWYWECPICKKLLAKHQKFYMGGGMPNFQSKGAASRHLMSHDMSYVNHGRNVYDVLKRSEKRMNEIVIKIRKATQEEFDVYQKFLMSKRLSSGIIKDNCYRITYTIDNKLVEHTIDGHNSFIFLLDQIKKENMEL